MSERLLLITLGTGVLIGLGVALSIQDTSQDKMCRGEHKVVETTDTIRTFTCTVELKK